MSTQIRRCGITSCKNFHNPDTKGSDVYFFNIPSLTTEYGKKWLNVLQNGTTKFSGSHICSSHFNPDNIEVFQTSTKGLKYVKLKRGAVPVKCGSALPAKETVHNAQVKHTIQLVDVDAIKKGSGTQNNKQKITPLTPLIFQPRLSTQRSSTKTLCNRGDYLIIEGKTKPKQIPLAPNSCAQCKVYKAQCKGYKDKLDLAEKRCQELEDFIRKNLKSVSNKDENSLGVSAENSPNSHLDGQEEALSDNDDGSIWNDNDIKESNEALSDNADNDVEMMDEIQPEKSKSMKPTPSNQINEDKSAPEVPKTVIMYNYYKCDMCNGSATFNSTSELKNHRKECHGDAHPSYDYEQGVSNQPIVYNNIGQIKERLIKRSLEPPVKIHIIEPPAKKRSIESATKIVKLATIVTPFKCGYCDEAVSFRTANELQRHMKAEHGKALRYECYICKIKLFGISDAKQHIRRHLWARSEKCKVCNEMLTPKEFNRHMCGREKSIQCDYCTESFDAMFKLIRHIDSEHSTEKILHRCGKCSRFYGMASLKDLHEIHHKEVSINYICEICSKGFSNKYLYDCHRKRHSTTKSFLCSICGMGFYMAERLAKHSEVHREKYIQCPECPAKFNTKRLLNFHREIHYPVKIKCSLCPKILTGRRSHRYHIRYVHNTKESDKKHACPFCPSKFSKKDKLQIHIRSHTGEKPHVCEYCPDRKFKYKGDLTKHLQTHFGSNIYKCESCEKAFRLYDELKQHSFEHYREERDRLGTETALPNKRE